MYVTQAVRHKTKISIFIFLPNHDAERYLTTVSLNNKSRCSEGKPASFLR